MPKSMISCVIHWGPLQYKHNINQCIEITFGLISWTYVKLIDTNKALILEKASLWHKIKNDYD